MYDVSPRSFWPSLVARFRVHYRIPETGWLLHPLAPPRWRLFRLRTTSVAACVTCRTCQGASPSCLRAAYTVGGAAVRHAAWTDPVYPLCGAQRWWWRVGCYFHCHVPGIPQARRPSDPTLSHGPCRRCGGAHYWRKGTWVAQVA